MKFSIYTTILVESFTRMKERERTPNNEAFCLFIDFQFSVTAHSSMLIFHNSTSSLKLHCDRDFVAFQSNKFAVKPANIQQLHFSSKTHVFASKPFRQKNL